VTAARKDEQEPEAGPAGSPTTRELFAGFLQVGLQGFGGVLPFARRMLVDERRWLDEREFVEVMSLSQFLPGPNIVNVAVIVGNRFRGPLGSVAAAFGLLSMPFLIVIALTAIYARFADLPAARGAAYGVTSAATGLIIATAFRMGAAIRGSGWQVIVAVVTFAAIALLRVPLLWALAAIAPVAVALAWMRR
jgi:chromate transporter